VTRRRGQKRSLVDIQNLLYERWSWHWDLCEEDRIAANAKRWVDVEETMAMFTRAIQERNRGKYFRGDPSDARHRVTFIARRKPLLPSAFSSDACVCHTPDVWCVPEPNRSGAERSSPDDPPTQFDRDGTGDSLIPALTDGGRPCSSCLRTSQN